MRARAWFIAVALLAACGEEPAKPAPPGAVPEPQRREEPKEVAAPAPGETTEAAAAREQSYRDAVEAKARAHALRTRLSDQRIALATSLAAADGAQREVLKGVHERTATSVFGGDAIMAIDTALDRADTLFADGHHAEAREAYAKAEKDLTALLKRLDAAEPTVRARLDLARSEATIATARARFAEWKLPPPADLARADDVLAEGRRLLDAGDLDGALGRASEVRAICDEATNKGVTLAAALKGAREQRGAVEVALGAWDKYIEGGGAETDLSRAARGKLAEGDGLLAANDPQGALAAYQEAALAFESAIDAIEATDKARLSELRTKTSPSPAPPDIARNPRIAGAVGRALDWLARHEDDDGRWDCAAFTKHDPGTERHGGGKAEFDVGVTALALLCFLDAGYVEKGGGPLGYYATNIAQALRFLRSSQDDEGVFGGRASKHFIYNHAIATLAVCEAYRRCPDARLGQSASRAVAFLQSARNPGMAWRYQPKDNENDTSVTAWCVRALVAARDAGLEVDAEAFKGALAWVDKMTDASVGQVGYNFPGGTPSRPEDLAARFPAARSQAMTAAGILIRVLTGEDPRTNDAIRRGAELILEMPPEWNESAGSIDMYYWHYATLAIRRAGGRGWPRWSRATQATCLTHQVSDAHGPDAGSWDPVDVWSEYGGRVYSTAMMTLTLIETARPAVK